MLDTSCWTVNEARLRLKISMRPAGGLPNDKHRLDSDSDSVACESLSGAPK
jgi:hypothetical protein